MKQVSTTGIVLSRTNFGEADRILTVLTPDHGKVRLLARGVRKIKSKLAGGIELFSLSHISFIVGRGEVRTLTSSRMERHFGQIVQDVDRTMFAYEVLKIINRQTEDETGAEYFNLLAAALAAIDDPAVSLELIRLWLYLQLLKHAGHSPNLRTDAAGGALAANQKYGFDLEHMAFTPAPRGFYDQRHIKFLRLALGLEAPNGLAKVSGAEAVSASCLTLAKSMLDQHLRV